MNAAAPCQPDDLTPHEVILGLVAMLSILIGIALVSLFCGCRSIDVAKQADGSWAAHYASYGLLTTLGQLDVTVGTNGVASLRLNDLNSDVSTNAVRIVDSSGKVIAEVIGGVVKCL